MMTVYVVYTCGALAGGIYCGLAQVTLAGAFLGWLL